MVQAALSVDVQVDKTLLRRLEKFPSVRDIDSYVVDVVVGAAVGVTTGAVGASGTGGNVAQTQETTVTVVLADNSLVAVAGGLATTTTVGGRSSSESRGREGEGSEDELHCDWTRNC